MENSTVIIIKDVKSRKNMRFRKSSMVYFMLLFAVALSVFVFAQDNLFKTDDKLELNEKSLSDIFGKNVKDAVFDEFIDDRDKIVNEFENNDKLEVIIWLKNNDFTSPAYQDDLDKKREEIGKLQDEALALFGEDEFKLKYKYIITNGFAGSITKEGFQKLIDDDLIGEIYLDGTVYLNLAESRSLINATNVEPMGYGGQGVTVCTIDTGVDYTHPDLGGCFGPGCKVIAGYDFCNGPSCSGGVDPDPMDERGHGTHVAGIVSSSNVTYRGVAPNANIMAIKVFNNNSNEGAPISAVTAGIDFCTNYAQPFNLKVITMSLGDHVAYTPQNCPTVYNNAIQNAVNSGIFVDASSGNDNLIGGVSSPACAPNVVSVGGTYDGALGLQIWSSCTDLTTGADKIMCLTNRGSNLDLLAPGASITSTALGGGFINFGGTSMAAPHVAGLAALMYQVDSSLSAVGIERIMKSSGKPIYDSATGLTFSRINARKAFANAGSPENWIFDKRLTFGTNQTISSPFGGTQTYYSQASEPSTAIDSNDNLHVVWKDNKYNLSSSSYEIYYKKLNNIGDSLTNDIRLTFNPSNSENPKIAVDTNNNLHLLWVEGTSSLYYKKLNSNGVSISPDIPVTNSYYPYNSLLDHDLVIDSGNNIHIVWRGSSGAIYYKKLNNNGINLTSELTIAAYNNNYRRPSIDADSIGNIHLTYLQPGSWNIANAILYKKLDNNGNNLTGEIATTYSWTESFDEPQIVADSNGNLHISYYRYYTCGSSTCFDVVYQKLTSNGGVVYSNYLGSGSNPSIAIDNNNNAHIVFNSVAGFMPNPINSEIKYAKVNSSGSVLVSDKRLTYDTSPSDVADVAVDSENNIHIVWQDSRDINNEIYYKRSFAPINMIGTPSIGSQVTFKISDPNNPNSVYGSALSFGTNQGIPLGDGRALPLNNDGAFYYSVAYPQQIGLSNTFGLLNNNGNGEFYWTIPNNPSIIGVNISIAFISVDASVSGFPDQINYISPPFTLAILP